LLIVGTFYAKNVHLLHSKVIKLSVIISWFNSKYHILQINVVYYILKSSKTKFFRSWMYVWCGFIKLEIFSYKIFLQLPDAYKSLFDNTWIQDLEKSLKIREFQKKQQLDMLNTQKLVICFLKWSKFKC
jgi:hypothetical protein